ELERVPLVSRAFDHDQVGPFCAELAALAGMDMVLPMNTGAEAVETGIKTARKWGYEVKGVPAGQAVIVTFEGNFHGRTTTIVSFSTDDDARASYGPYTPGFRVVPYGDPAALAAAMDERVGGGLGGAGGGRRHRADPGRGRGGRAAAGLPESRPGGVHHARGADDRRRDPVRAGPHGDHVCLRARGREAGHVPAGQGARRRHRAGLGGGVHPRGPRRGPARPARLPRRRPPAPPRGPARGGRRGV